MRVADRFHVESVPAAEKAEPPIETGILTMAGLEAHARDLAPRLEETSGSRHDERVFFDELDAGARLLRDAYRRIAAVAGEGEALLPAAEWLLDNYHLIEASFVELGRNLPPSYYRQLPKVRFEGRSTARVCAMAIELVRHTDGNLDLQRLTRFVFAYQTAAPLTIGELWAWPCALEAALLDRLAALSEEILRNRSERTRADEVFARFEGRPESEPPPLPANPSSAFTVRLLQRLREAGSAHPARARLEEALSACGRTVEDCIQLEHQRQATAQALMGNAVTSLRLCAGLDWSHYFERVSVVEQTLQRDPAAVYARMTFASRNQYREAVEELAIGTGEDQLRVALRAIELARHASSAAALDDVASHVGYYLVGAGRATLERECGHAPRFGARLRRFLLTHATSCYLASIATVAALFMLAAVAVAHARPAPWWIVLLLAVPASELATGLVQWFFARFLPPRSLPRLDLKLGVPEEGRTMVIIPTLLTSPSGVRALVEHLEVLALGNLDPHIHFAILGDFGDAATRRSQEDADILEAARSGLAELRLRHGDDRFYFFHRERLWNPREGCWMGWERKRGKIEEFNRLLRGATDTSYSIQDGNLSLLPRIRYCLTLDRDTTLPRDAGRALIGILLHPLNRARIDREVGRVVAGYGILQPRVTVSLPSATASLFARIYAGHTGVDPYTKAVSDTYQDLFGEGIFTGKGLYDVDAFTTALENRAPENAILSHDLFEGLFARVALVSDVELVDDYPPGVLAHARRQRRWVRGDWQLLLWLLPRVPTRRGWERNPLSAIARWKIFDNLRRSLVPMTTVLLFAAAWTILPGSAAAWTGVALATLAMPILPPLARFVRGPRDDQAVSSFVRAVGQDLAIACMQVLFATMLLLYHAVELLDAVLVTLVRVVITRRRLLEWETAARAARMVERTSLLGHQLEMATSSVPAGILLVLLAATRPASIPVAAPLIALWLAAPTIGWASSRPALPRGFALSGEERAFVRRAARKTWHYFEAFVGPADHWLPPDNYQEAPAEELGRRTSPTNIGLGLLATLAAYDFGFLRIDELLERIERSLDETESLERYEGHLLNWYDTATKAPLRPRYVSTVDSGNLAACLVTLAMGLRAAKGTERTVAPARGWVDTARLLLEELDAGEVRNAWKEARSLRAPVERLLAARARHGGSRETTPGLVALAAELERAAETFSRNVPASGASREVSSWARRLADELRPRPAMDPAEVDERLERSATRCLAFVDAMSFRFLFDPQRMLFSIGYRLPHAEGPGRLDEGYYDLLASEARVASFIAVARAEVPQAHWFHLGRALVGARGKIALVSWSASMFEYLMPLLFMRSYPGTLLDRTVQNVVRNQIDYGRSHGVPWGISESAYALVDAGGRYQYQAFGVPGLGLKRGLANDLIVSPYSTALASLVDPAPALRNLKRLAKIGLEGRYGYYEAIDYGGEGRPRGGDPGGEGSAKREARIVRAYFAHHAAMTLVALDNLVTDFAMVNRFHADPRMHATELLLQERVPRLVTITQPRPQIQASASLPAPAAAVRRFRSPRSKSPRAAFLSNGSYTTIVTNAGGGASLCRGVCVTRVGEDATRDLPSQLLYLRDVRSGTTWSPTYQPPPRVEPSSYVATFEADKAVFRRGQDEIDTVLEIAVSPEEDVEVRRLFLVNRSDRVREIEITSYAELTLSPLADDLAHPVFARLFIETSYVPEMAAILARRRRRDPDDAERWGIHVMGVEGRRQGPIEWETDRARFLGRGRDATDPIALDGRPLSGRTGAVLDPCASLRTRVRLAPGGSARLAFATGMAATRDAALALASKYQNASAAARALSLAYTHAQSELRHLGITAEDAQSFQRLASRTVFLDGSMRVREESESHELLGQSGLWRLGISGDLPILLVRIFEESEIELLGEVLRAHQYWRLKGIKADVVVLNEHATDYRDEVHRRCEALIDASASAGWKGRPGGIHLVRGDAIREGERALLYAVSRAALDGRKGSLVVQLDAAPPEPGPPGRARGAPPGPTSNGPAADGEPRRARAGPPGRAPEGSGEAPVEVPGDLLFANGLGGFGDGGREYVIVLDGDAETPQPWANVIANPRFGTIVTASGSAFTWAANSRENRITPFANDPVSDATAEALFLRDEMTGETWSPTPGPMKRRPGGPRWIVRHGAGSTTFEHVSHGIRHELRVFVYADDPVKGSLLTLTNLTARTRRIGLFAYVEWILGPPRAGERLHVVTERHPELGAVLARNPYNEHHPDQVAFAALGARNVSATGDRLEFLGRHGSLASPAALAGEKLGERFGRDLDPCAALFTVLELPPNSSRTVSFALGAGRDREEAEALLHRVLNADRAESARALAVERWRALLDRVHVHTPDDSFDVLMNGWLLYQALSSRLFGRSGYYQPGGAYGFRDQLQDVLAFLPLRPELAREQLLRAAARQFVQGDVQHWWHPEDGRGVRTRCSDDRLWLPFAAAEYVAATGDDAVLEVVVPFLEAPALEEGQWDAYSTPSASTQQGTLYEHCVRATELGLSFGPRGLPRIGTGDWNDGMNRLGHHGHGESIWLGWFLYTTLHAMAPFAEARGDEARAARYRAEAANLAARLELEWDGDWYRRAYADDGSMIGSAQSAECRIDSISQSWAVLSGAAQTARAERAMDAVRTHLILRPAGIVLLLTPPFDTSSLEPGYIKGYPPGVRENGGQYTHAAIWVALASARLGNGDEAVELFHLLNPINHTRNAADVGRYLVEPYVVAADLGARAPHEGRGGWTWYTGSAAWMYRLGLEGILGLHRRGGTFEVRPCIPAQWPGFSIRWQFGTASYAIEVERVPGQDVERVATLDDVAVDPDAIPLADDGRTHRLRVRIG